MENHKIQKISLITILLLLFLFLPLTGYSIYLKTTGRPSNTTKENNTKELFYDGKLWFYNKDGNLLGTYTCVNTYCSYGTSYENDSDYALETYKAEESVYLPIINDQYAFIKDTNDESSHAVFLYDIKNNFAYKDVSYASVKNYQIGFEDDLFIVENNTHQFGLLKISSVAVLQIPYAYDYIGALKTQNEEGKLLNDYFVALKDGEWCILTSNGAKVTENIAEEIVTFNGEYILTKEENDLYHVVNYNGERMLDSDYIHLSFTGRYLNCQTEDTFYVYDFTISDVISSFHPAQKEDVIETTIANNTLTITKNGKIEETVSLS